MILVDANVLLRLIQVGHPHQQPALDSIIDLRVNGGEDFSTCPQVLYEMYAVCTRPLNAPNPGLGLAPVVAMGYLEAAERQFPVAGEALTTLSKWKELVVRYGVLGKSAHDARLAAFMIEKQISKLLTFNDAHFLRYAEIATLNPFDVLGIPRVQ